MRLADQEGSVTETLKKRFRGFLPVVVDVETGGFNQQTDALLEVAAVLLDINEQGVWRPAKTLVQYVEPFEGANLNPAAMEVTGIKVDHPFRKQIAVNEKTALNEIFKSVNAHKEKYNCKFAILVGHNAFFDLGFLAAAVGRSKVKHNPFHKFSTFDTVSLAGLHYGQTVLSRAVQAAGFPWDESEAHSARYDAEQTAQLFCHIVNRHEILLRRESNEDKSALDALAPNA
ncbi:MAG: ribonuclease T [Candidatus Eutrophobiaceae bacterium]